MTSPPADRLVDAEPGERGFTLIEVVVVLTILALVAGLVLVRAPHRGGALDMRQASSLVAGTLRVARARAIASNRPIAVRFEAETASLHIDNDQARRLPPGIGLVGGPRMIMFRPDGSSSGGRVELAGGARSAEIDVNWLTGRIVSAARP